MITSKVYLAILILLVTFFSPITRAFDVNTASTFELESTRGIGQKMAQVIIIERTAHGVFKDWSDFKARVKGIGDKNIQKMQSNGLTLNKSHHNGGTIQQ